MLGVSPVELQGVVPDVGLWHIYQQHVAGDAAVVPPVEDECRHVLTAALVVDFHGDEVLARLQQVGHIVVERGEAADMPACLLPVDEDDGFVVDGSEVEQCAMARLGLIVERAVEPYCALIEEEALVAGVPV